MKTYIKLITAANCLISIISCNTPQKQMHEIVQEWSNKEIIFPSLAPKIFERDTQVSFLHENQYKILSYIDTNGCTPCNLHLYDWKIFMKEIEIINKNIPFIFILHLDDYNEYVKLQRKNKFSYPVFYDSKGEFISKNKLPQQLSLHTFLLNKNNKVVAIGNPIINFDIRNLYKQIIKDSTTNEK